MSANQRDGASAAPTAPRSAGLEDAHVSSLLRRSDESEHAMQEVIDELPGLAPELLVGLVRRLLHERREAASADTVRALHAKVEEQLRLIHRLEDLSDEAQEAVASCAIYEEQVGELEAEHQDVREMVLRVLKDVGAEEHLPLRDGVERLIEEVVELRKQVERKGARRLQ